MMLLSSVNVIVSVMYCGVSGVDGLRNCGRNVEKNR